MLIESLPELRGLVENFPHRGATNAALRIDPGNRDRVGRQQQSILTELSVGPACTPAAPEIEGFNGFRTPSAASVATRFRFPLMRRVNRVKTYRS